MKSWLKITLSALFALGVITLLVLSGKNRKELLVPEPQITIEVVNQNAFLNEEEVKKRLNRAGLIFEGQRFEQLNLEAIQRFLVSISQVREAKVYRGLGDTWKIEIKLRDPIARIFNSAGESFYLDKEGFVMSNSPLHTAHCVVVNGHIPDRKNSASVPDIINNDSLISIRKLDDIYRISNYVCEDPVLHSLIGQIYLEKNGDFLLTPLVGEQRIVFGSAYSEKEVEDKFKKLRIFYDEAIITEGWDKYSEIILKFDGQIVCKKKELGE